MPSSTLLKIEARRLGFDLCGVCEPIPAPHQQEYRQWIAKGYHAEMDYLRRHEVLKEDPRHLLPSVRSMVAVALNYNQPNEPRVGKPRIARYALGRDYHKVLRGKLRRLSDWIVAHYPEAECRPCVDSAPIFERDYAHLAGLGWFGKNTMLIDSKRGSWFFLGLLLTSAVFEPDAPAVGGCGGCTRCVEACPTGAIVFEEGRWQVDARRCVSYLTIEHEGDIPEEFAERMDGWTFGCDVCQEVCPFNHPRVNNPLRAQSTREPDFLDRREWPSLVEMAEMDEPEWDVLTRGSAVRRTGLGGLRRNARISLRHSRGGSATESG